MPRPRVLVADDNPLSLRFLADALAALDVDCACAADGGQALAQACEDRFDLLMLDLNMPQLDGAQVLARLRGAPGPCADTPALATTAQMDAARADEWRRAGFAEVLAKPLGIAELRAALARRLPGWGGTAAPALLDDAQALTAAAGDAAIVAALRRLFVAELASLPSELAALAADIDLAGLRERLHRLDASAGFCGAPQLQHAIAALRATMDAARPERAHWPAAECAALLDCAARLQAALAPAPGSA